MRFIYEDKLYDTEKAFLMAEYSGYESQEGNGDRVYKKESKLYRTINGRWFKVSQITNHPIHREERAEVLHEREAKRILRMFPDKYITAFGEVEEA